MRGDSGQDPSWSACQSLAPGWGREREAEPQRCSCCSGPRTPPKTPDGPGLRNGTAAPHTHAGTQGHSVTTMLKLRRGKEQRTKKIFQCLLLGTLGTQVGACALGRGHLALKESSMGAGGYRAGTSTEIMYKGKGCPHSAPKRAELAHGGGCM